MSQLWIISFYPWTMVVVISFIHRVVLPILLTHCISVIFSTLFLLYISALFFCSFEPIYIRSLQCRLCYVCAFIQNQSLSHSLSRRFLSFNVCQLSFSGSVFTTASNKKKTISAVFFSQLYTQNTQVHKKQPHHFHPIDGVLRRHTHISTRSVAGEMNVHSGKELARLIEVPLQIGF